MTTSNTAPVSATPVSIDYTGRDFYALREELILRVKERTAYAWQGTDASDFGLALIEAFSYMGDVTNYYIDRMANESSMTTATQRSSILNIARTYGYNPAGYRSASCTALITNKTADSITVPSGTQLSGSYSDGDLTRQVIFTTVAPLTLSANASDTVSVTHGENISLRYSATLPDVAGEQAGVSTGQPQQTFVLSENQVVDNTVRVFVQTGASYGEWSSVLHLSDYGPTDSVYSISTDENNYVTITFGDGVSGAIPAIHSAIKVQYVVGGGIYGNIPVGTLRSVKRAPGLTTEQSNTLIGSVSVTNTVEGVGGLDPESTETIRYIAPLSITAMNRAVTLGDFSSLALTATSVGKATSVGTTPTSVTVYAAPRRDVGNLDPYPGYSGTWPSLTLNTFEWSAIKADVESALSSKTLIGTTVTVSPPVYVPVKLSVQFVPSPMYTADQVKADIETLINTYYSYNYIFFDKVIYPEEVEYLIRFLPGVYNAKVIYLNRKVDADNRSVLISSGAELFAFAPTDVTVTAAATESALSGLTASTGTFTPLVSASGSPSRLTSENYSLQVGSSATTVTLTPTATDAVTSTITVAGVATTSGSGHAVSLPTTVTTVQVIVTAQDQTTSTLYTVTITKV